MDLVLDGLVECTGHAIKLEHGGEGEVGVGTILESDRGEADEVGFPVLTHGRVDNKVDAGSCCDVDRDRVSCGLGQGNRNQLSHRASEMYWEHTNWLEEAL